MEIVNQKTADRNAPILERIEALRKERGMTKTALYKMMNVSAVAATHWRSGKNKISEKSIELAASGFGVDPIWLLTGTKNAATPEDDGEMQEAIRLFRVAPQEIRAAVVQLLKAAERQAEAPGASSKG